ncbi:MAG: hypothetical protein ACLFU0_05355 [Alphaproteobacteria bacterium]
MRALARQLRPLTFALREAVQRLEADGDPEALDALDGVRATLARVADELGDQAEIIDNEAGAEGGRHV